MSSNSNDSGQASMKRRAEGPNVGEPAPWFYCRSTGNPRYCFDTVAGRYVILCFLGSSAHPTGRELLTWVAGEATRFDDVNLAFFGVSTDPADEQNQRLVERVPGIRFFWDFDRTVSGLYGVNAGVTVFVLDPLLRVVARVSLDSEAGDGMAQLKHIVATLPAIAAPVHAQMQAPILVAENLFEPALCRRLMDYFQSHGGRDSGFMRDVDGRTVELRNYQHKRRSDCTIENEMLKRSCMIRMRDRLAPLIERAFQFRANRMERYIVACYEAETGGHFRAHRDNTTKGTAHRRFAVSLNLNTGEYDGGYLRFPEFGSQLYEAPAGGAVVFSCSLLHEATPITKGKRYAFLPFLYDDAAAALRERNRKYLESP